MNSQQQGPHFELQQQVPVQSFESVHHDVVPDQLADLYGVARNKFIVKVYSVLGMQLLITAIFVTLAVLYEPFTLFLLKNTFLYVISAIAAISIMIAFICKRQLTSRYPKNMILLAAFTLAQAYTVSAICALYEPQSVLLAAIITAASTIGLTIYAVTTKTDFTTICSGLLGVLSSYLMMIMTVSMFAYIFNFSFVGNIAFFGIGLLYPIYLVYDTQLIINDIKNRVNIDQFILASIFLYVDIIGIFIRILRLLGQRRS